MTSFYLEEELSEIGFASCGEDVLISRKASIYGAENISIGNHVRIDDFCLLSGKMTINNYIHISAYTALYGGNVGIYLDNYVTISSRTSVYAITDDYSGEAMSNPMIPEEFRAVFSEPVVMEKHVMIGASSVILPGVTLREGSSFGAFSLITRDSEEWSINVGIPAAKIKERGRNPLELAERLEKS